MESIHLSNCFSHFYPLTQFIFANACMRLISPGRRAVLWYAMLLTQLPEAERLLLVKGSDASWLPPAALNSSYMPTEIKPPVMWIKKRGRRRRRRSASRILALTASVRCITATPSFAGSCVGLSGAAPQQKAEASLSVCGSYLLLTVRPGDDGSFLTSPPPPGFHLHYQRF